MATEDLTTEAGRQAFFLRHGNLSGTPTKVSPDTDKYGVVNPDPFYRYTMTDGSSVEVNSKGEIQSIDEKSPSVATGTAQPAQSQTAPTTKQYQQYNTDGSVDTYTYQYNPATKGWDRNDQIPVEHKPADANLKPPSDPSKWLQIHANPSDPNSKVIAIQDPANASNRVTVPQDTQPTRPTTVSGPNGSVYSWDGTTLSPLIAGTPEKQQIVQGQGGAIYSWDGQKLTVIDPGQAKSTEGQTRTILDTKTGHNVQQTYQGGEWTTTKDLGVGTTGAAQEGDTRTNINQGYNVTETYQNGQWNTTKIGDRAIPKDPTVINAPANQANIASMGGNGQITTQANPNFIPTSQAEVGARVSQLQQQASAKKDELMGKVGPMYTVQQAQNDWNQWWNQNVEPQKASLQQIGQQAAAEESRKAQEQERLNYSTAQTAGTNAVDAFKASAPYRVGPGWADLMGKMVGGYQGGAAPTAQDINAGLVFQGPDLNQLSQQATAQALAHISPMAASIAGAPPPAMAGMGPQDITAGLNRQNYAFPGGGAPQQMAEGGGAPGTIPGPQPNPLTAGTDLYPGLRQGNGPYGIPAPAVPPYMQNNWQQPPNSNPWGTYQPGY